MCLVCSRKSQAGVSKAKRREFEVRNWGTQAADQEGLRGYYFGFTFSYRGANIRGLVDDLTCCRGSFMLEW